MLEVFLQSFIVHFLTINTINQLQDFSDSEISISYSDTSLQLLVAGQ